MALGLPDFFALRVRSLPKRKTPNPHSAREAWQKARTVPYAPIPSWADDLWVCNVQVSNSVSNVPPALLLWGDKVGERKGGWGGDWGDVPGLDPGGECAGG